jgi:hypothetical protein
METLYALRETAKNDPKKREVLLVLPGGRIHNAKFLDPWLGALIFRDLPDNVVHTRDIDEIKTVGIFTD